MVAGGTGSQVRSWETEFLHDIHAPGSDANYNYLTHWMNREGGWPDRAHWNLLRTTERMPGSYGVNSVGVQSYNSMQQGALANARALQENHPGYAQLLAGLRGGNPQLSTNYQGLGTWSGGGYTNLAGTSGGGGGSADPNEPPYRAPPGGGGLDAGTVGANNADAAGAAGAAISHDAASTQFQLSQLLAQYNSDFARQEAGFQNRFLGVSEEQLGVQRGALHRQMQEAGPFQDLQEKQFGLQLAGIKESESDLTRHYLTNSRQLGSQLAGQGATFTQGGGEARTNLKGDYRSQMHGLQRAETSLGLQKKGEEMTYFERVMAMHDQDKNLDLMAKRFGISREEIQARLSNTLRNIGLGAQYGQVDLITQMMMADIGFTNSLAAPLPAGVGVIGGGVPGSGGYSGVPGGQPMPSG